MKGGSNRVEAADEWVNGSWTVDCICGVTFDDGEEMVNCDECGVWVHTRCSRYVKGHKSFACDKCKSQRRTSDQTETEVAQLLAELPTKTIQQHQHQHQHQHRPKIKMSPTTTTSSSSPYRLWTQRPLQERVHVQGVPGGPSSLFHSTAFPLLISPLLWKSSGYIPKHFNFRYSEFPSSQLPPALTNPHHDLVNTEGVGELQATLPQSPHLTNDMPKPKLIIEDSKRKHTEILQNPDAVSPLATDNCSNETKSYSLIDNPKGGLSDPAGMGMDIESDSIKNLIENEPNISKPFEQDSQDNVNGIEAMAGSQFDRNSEMTDVEINAKLECSSMQVPIFLRGSKESARVAGQKSQLSGPIVPPPPSHHKTSSLGQTSSISPTNILPRSSLSNKSRSGCSHNLSSVGKCLVSNSYVNNNKEYAPVELTKNKDKHDKLMSVLKDIPKPCYTPTLKPSQSSTVLKYNTSAGKDSLMRSSSKPSVDCSSASSSFGEPARTLQGEHGLLGQNKNIAFGDRQQGEKDPASNFQPSSKSNQSSTGHPTASSNAPAGLSDEELALLLHQELNSSPRVPRVPRVRHPGSLPQLSAATAANMLMKRTSTSGGKDKNTFSRRKSRGALKDGSHNSCDQDTEASKGDRVPSSSSDSLQKPDSVTLAEVNTDSKMKKNLEKISSSPANSGPFSTDAVDFKSLSTRVDIPEDEAGANKNSDPTYRTLPGLIAEIMGTGRRMTYEELCNAVLPHWSNLRKHNGERYAYSSHSQAVLDCLRNRTEWARLVDRGPKTSSSRKKRKVDAEPVSSESEEGEDKNPRDGENKSFESNKEEFPKGRRKARKRRKAAPPGRSVKDGQKRRKVEAGSSCDSGSFSNSGEDSISSQDDCGGSETNVAKIEVLQVHSG